MFPLLKLSPLSLSTYSNTPLSSILLGFLEQHRRILPSLRNWKIMTLFINFDWYFLSSSSRSDFKYFLLWSAAIVEAISIQSEWLTKLIISFRSFLFPSVCAPIEKLSFFVMKSTSLRGFWHQNEARLVVWEIWKSLYFLCPLFNRMEGKNLLCACAH